MRKSRKGQFGSQTGFIVFSVMFIILVSYGANLMNVEGVSCSDPSNLIDQPDENISTFEQVYDSSSGLVDVLFGCSSDNQLLNGFFIALSAGMIVILLSILKDVIPFT